MPLALDQARNADDDGRVAQTVALAQVLAGGGIKCELLGVDRAVKLHDFGLADEWLQALEGCLREVGDDVGVAEDLLEDLAGSRDHRPCVVEMARSAPASRAAFASRPSGAAAPNQMFFTSWSRMMRCICLFPSGVGSIIVPG